MPTPVSNQQVPYRTMQSQQQQPLIGAPRLPQAQTQVQAQARMSSMPIQTGPTFTTACQWLAEPSSIRQVGSVQPAASSPERASRSPSSSSRSSHNLSLSQSRSRSGSSSCSRSSFGSFEREAELNDLVDCFREQTRHQQHQQQRPPAVSADARELVSALQDHLKSAVAAAAAAAAAAASTQSLAVPSQTTPPVVSHQTNDRRENCQPPARQDFAPLDLKILHDYDWHDSSQSSSRSSNSPMGQIQPLDSSPQTDFNEIVDIEVDDEPLVQRTEIVQTLTSEPQTDASVRSTDAGAQNLVTTTRLGAPTPSVSGSSLLASNNRGCEQRASSGSNHTQDEETKQEQQRQKRMFKCRHCPFETDQKVENWLHIRIHMRPERLLSCGSCEFVTEYKHHLEYHQRNHTGYKPFKCPHCDYTCVNKSMLNSHMKSHSTVYQYQCGDCKYATKYVHSLKMHLRKYQHQPAEFMIDIFARKRGPKPGSGRKQQLLKQQELERQIKEQVEQQRALQALQGITTPPNSRRGGGSRRARQQQQQQQQQQPPAPASAPQTQPPQQQRSQCVLDLRVSSKLRSQ